MSEAGPSEEAEHEACVWPNRVVQLVEVAIFLSLIVPSMILSAFTYLQGRIGFPLLAWVTMLRDVSLTALVAYFLWRAGEPLWSLGWKLQGRDFLLGALLFAPFLVLTSAVEQLAHVAGAQSASDSSALPFLLPKGHGGLALATALVIVVAVSEETLFRGYLLLRLRGVSCNLPLAVAVSSLIFALGHGYEGSLGMVAVGFMGVVFALVYLWRGNLAAPIAMHFLQDFLGIVVMPALGHR